MKKINQKELHELLTEIKTNKNESTYNELYRKYKELVYSIAFSILKQKEDSEDVAQRVFTKLWTMNSQNLPSSYEASWLYRLTKNEALNYLRNHKKTINLEELYSIHEEDDEIKKLLDQDAYNRLIAKLSQREQEVISLKLVSGLSFKQISQVIQEPIGTVQWRYYHSLKNLKLGLTNLLMLMFTLGIYGIIKRKNNFSETQHTEIEQSDNTSEKEDEINQSESINKSEEKTMQDEIPRKEQENSENHIKQEQEETNETVEQTIAQEQPQQTNTIELGLLSISGVFLILTIIFFIFFHKSQQKIKKKVSK